MISPMFKGSNVFLVPEEGSLGWPKRTQMDRINMLLD
jgi:hypothetical protein